MEISQYSTVLVVAAHPDDDILGCGGTVSKLCSSGSDVRVIFLSDGVSSRYEDSEAKECKSEIELRKKSAIAALFQLGVIPEPIFFDLPDNQLDKLTLLSVTKFIEKTLGEFRPELVLTHFPGDLNIDHSIVSRATLTALRPGAFGYQTDIWFFEVASSSELSIDSLGHTFRPNIFIDISTEIDQKMAALREYDFEMREFPHPRSEYAIRSLAAWRGAGSNMLAAEAFMASRLQG